jgi:hypothetical protein
MATGTSDFAQYAGELYLFGTSNMPLLAALGSGGLMVSQFDFALSSSATLASGVQQAITETASMADPQAWESFARDQNVNTCQIVQKFVKTSYKAMSSYNKVIGDSSDYGTVAGVQSIDDIHNWNTTNTLKQIYKDLNFTAWNGAYVRSTGAGVAAKTRGLNAAITTYAYTASVSVANMTKAKVDTALAAMADAGIDMSGIALFMNSALKIKVSDLYSLSLQTAPRDRNIGGVDVQSLVTDFGVFPIIYDSTCPAGKVFMINLPYIKNVWCPVPGKGNLFYEEKEEKAAARSGMIYGQWGLDYGAEEVHGTIVTTDAA